MSSFFHNELSRLLTEVPELINSLTDDDFSKKPAPEKWSKKEILGHLIDSAIHNLQRFVRVPFEDDSKIVYNQDQWVIHQFHQTNDKAALITLWTALNQQILYVVDNIPVDALVRTTNNGSTSPVTLQFVIDDYIDHLKHHLAKIKEA